jgi:phosphoribosylanthranilate isomerase
MLIKICGNTKEDQCVKLERMGVDMLGFIFVKKSPRYIEPCAVSSILEKLEGQVQSVGVFQDHSLHDVKRLAEISGVDMVQLHGNESPDFVAALDIPVIKSFSITPDFNFESIQEYDGLCRFFLLDSKVGNQAGGTGIAFDWSVLSSLSLKTPWLLAGGIGLHNMAGAMNTGAWGVDLNSQVEVKPGVKDLDLVKQCIAQITGQ